jgi:uncharacterized protein YfdQ (DUF2303 family)
MFDKDAIKELAQAEAITAASKAVAGSFADDKAIVALPAEFTVHDLEKNLPLRRRARGIMTTSSVAPFAEYVNQHKEPGAAVFVDQDAMTAVAVLNLGTPNDPGHADNIAKMVAKRLAAFTALLQHANGGGLAQAKAAEFMEDWPGYFKFFKDSTEITPGQAIAAVRKLTIEAMRKLEATEQQLSATRSAFESVSATSTEPLPTTIYFNCVPYHGLNERQFVLRLGVLTSAKDPAVVLRIVNKEQHDEEMAAELAVLVDSSLSASGVPVMVGKYQATA